ncbi:hypothetical protein [Streptomyces sp. NRRL F-5193]|uniref:hypothetical protein n=1 Tax=Streptomyces sp. NRRL F-5193 TaxID=1463860 RepID=UPI0005BBB1CA|nr:hypothetical protein [Streptomyces sp. NRRL F-5193]
MRFVRSHPARLLAAGLLAAGTLSLTAAAGPAAADVVEPNVSGLAHPNASFTDDLTEALTETFDDADYAGDAKTDPDPTAPESDGPATDPAPSPSVTTPAPPAPGPGPVHGGTGGGGSMAGTGAGGERLWLLGALAVVLGATGLVAKAAMRGHRG